MQVFLSCLLCVTVPDLILILWYINCYFDFEDKGGVCFWKCFLNITIETSFVCATHKEYQKSSEILRFSYICAWLSLNRSGIHRQHELKRLRFFHDWLEVSNWIAMIRKRERNINYMYFPVLCCY